jgi:transporter family protein
MTSYSFCFIVLSGLATGVSWLCYYKALKIGEVNKVAPIDKLSTVFTILLALGLLQEGLNLGKVLATCFIGVGSVLMAQQKSNNPNQKLKKGWLMYALLAALFASLTTIFAKLGIKEVESNLATALRTIVVLIMAWLIVVFQKKIKSIKPITKKSWIFIILSGIATGLSWLCFYRALKIGPTSLVVPIDKLSILFTIGFSYFILKEKLANKALFGLVLIVVGTLSLVLIS